MALTTEERDILIETQTIVKRLEKTMNSDTGTPRCAKQTEKLNALEKSQANMKKVMIALGSPLVVALLYAVLTG